MAGTADDVYMAKLSEQAERYDEMVEYMKKVANAATDDLSLEERNLLSVAYKNVVGARRASLRIIGSIESKEKEKSSDKVPLVNAYKAKVEEELNTICNDILLLLDNTLIAKAAASAEASVFYLKMKADYYRAPQPPSPPAAAATMHALACTHAPHAHAHPHAHTRTRAQSRARSRLVEPCS